MIFKSRYVYFKKYIIIILSQSIKKYFRRDVSLEELLTQTIYTILWDEYFILAFAYTYVLQSILQVAKYNTIFNTT